MFNKLVPQLDRSQIAANSPAYDSEDEDRYREDEEMEETPVVDERAEEKSKAIEASMSSYGGGTKKNILSGKRPKTSQNADPNERGPNRRSSLGAVAKKQDTSSSGPSRRSSTANLAGPTEIHAEEHKIEITRKEGLLLGE
jgi:hypothetical protein